MSSDTKHAKAERTRPPQTSGTPYGVLVVMCAGYFLVLLDVTIVNVALPSIGTGLHVPVSTLQWVVDAYALALASLMLPSGTVGDRFGHRRVVLAGLAGFGLGSLACGLATGAGALTAARAAQGVGAALLLPGTLAIISDTFPEQRAKARAIGVWAGIGSLALPAGPLLGGVLIDAFGWRSVFLINVPVVIAATVATAVVVRPGRPRPDLTVDRWGAALGVVLLVCATYAVIEAGRAGAPAAPAFVAAVVAVAALALLIRVERRRGDEAMLPPDLMRRPRFATANVAAGVMNLGTLGTLFVLTLFLQSVQHRSPLSAGVALVPLFAPLAVIAPFAGRLIGRIGELIPAVAGLVLSGIGLAMLVLVHPASSYPAVLLPAFLAWGVGLGLLTPALVAAAVSAAPARRSGLASAVTNTARQAGGAIGIAVAGAVAGPPASHGFLSGLHAVAAGSAVLYALTAVLLIFTTFVLRDPGHER
jgi:DHA2 family methylenomycin A resistance protein-like MFS transporter